MYMMQVGVVYKTMMLFTSLWLRSDPVLDDLAKYCVFNDFVTTISPSKALASADVVSYPDPTFRSCGYRYAAESWAWVRD